MTSEERIRDRLVEHGSKLLQATPSFYPFTKIDEADSLLNDLQNFPHAFVIACIMDRQVKAERAWLIPFLLQQKLGDFSMSTLLRQSERDFRKLMTKPRALHRFAERMATCIFRAIQRIETDYDSDAARIWDNKPSSATVVYRFLEFDGVGPKIASMAANLLARNFKIPFSDYYSIDISADVHVRRVFSRLGLAPKDASVDQLIFRARGLYPQFPGIMDSPAWEIGRAWCRPRLSQCHDCYMRDLCPTALSNAPG